MNDQAVPSTAPQPQDLHEIFQERWESLVAMLFQQQQPQSSPDLQRKPSQQEGDYETQSDTDSDDGSWTDDETTLVDDNTVNHELDQLHFDLDFTERSIADLEVEFAEDLEALAEGLECAFDQFEDDNFVATLQKQEAQLSQSTRSNFKSNLEESIRTKRKKRHSVVEFPDGFEVQEEDDYFKTWFEKFWSAIERLFACHATEQHQKNPGSVTKTFFQLWMEA